ncbi:Fur-regulated basic protein FbpA [Sporolactobacillus kofuensis]|uniref:Fur-regulated basic protein FbpA n=1 Tax=Sporolactobacillus kofuensis TaxID=269672 RepID=A0ABW1WEE0_9BACL|nr:Fur-regulated basic protein FbpA [Sporolactobacillus kofuensis]MCO7174540.1 Fur-regulated basic protein FbpA [Sporolactobacillus kofuensis]
MTESRIENNEKRKNDLIRKLLDRGIFKNGEYQLYELSLSELEHTYNKNFYKRTIK